MNKHDALARKEHEAIRYNVGYYDFTHPLLEVNGPDAEKFLCYMYVASIAGTDICEAVYTTMLNEEGNIIDDVIVFREGQEKFWISTLYIEELKDWFNKYKGDNDIVMNDITDVSRMYAVQGPNSKELLNEFVEDPVDDLDYFMFHHNKIDGVHIQVARIGYTGELGYEIYCHPDHAKLMEEKLEEFGKKYDAMKITTDVILTSIPREKGFVLMSDVKGTNPLEAGFGWSIQWKKDFVGKEALLKVKEEGAKRSLLGFTVDEDDPKIEVDDIVKINNEAVGRVTVFTFGFTADKYIGYALVENDKAKIGDEVMIGDVKAILTERMFYDPKNLRVRS